MECNTVFILGFVLFVINITASKHLPDNVKANTVNMLVEEVAELKKNVASLQTRVLSLENATNSTGTDALVHNFRSSRTKRAVRLRKIPEVAFQATLTKLKVTVREKVPIKFNKVHTNIGNAYSSTTGIFTAPARGTYTFSTSIVAEEGHYVEACIQVGDDVKASAISDHRNNLDIWDQGSATAIVHLHKGAKVYVSVQWPYGEHVIHGVGRTSFSGHLIRAHGFQYRRGYSVYG